MSNINAYLEGSLSEEERREIELVIKTDIEAATLLQQYRQHVQELHRIYDGVLNDPVPVHILNSLKQKKDAKNHKRRSKKQEDEIPYRLAQMLSNADTDQEAENLFGDILALLQREANLIKEMLVSELAEAAQTRHRLDSVLAEISSMQLEADEWLNNL
jgi:hypothetical protein